MFHFDPIYRFNIYSKTIVINAGINHQIDNNFAVINERGLVGKVLSVSNNNSKILLINDICLF